LNPEAVGSLATLLSVTGRHAQAIEAGERGVKVDPLSSFARSNLGLSLFFARKYDDALSQLKSRLNSSRETMPPTSCWG